MQIAKYLIVILLSVLPQYANAETYRCTDSYGTVSYTNTRCPDKHSASPVKNQVNVIDNSEERRYIERGLAEAKAKLENINEAGAEVAGQAKAAALAQRGQVNSLIKTALAAKEQLLWVSIIMVAAVGAFALFMRRNRRKQ